MKSLMIKNTMCVNCTIFVVSVSSEAINLPEMYALNGLGTVILASKVDFTAGVSWQGKIVRFQIGSL